MRTPTCLWLAVLLVLGSGSSSSAQVIEGPQGGVGGLFGGHRRVNPNRTSQSLDVSLDLSGGYDRDPNASLLTNLDPFNSPISWYAATATATTRYKIGTIKRSLEASGGGLFNYQTDVHDSLVGGDTGLNGVARFGRRSLNQLSLNLQASYQPGWAFGASGPEMRIGVDENALPVDHAPLGVAPPQGIFEQRWLVMSGSSGYQQYWNQHHQTIVQFNAGRVRPVEGSGQNSGWQSAKLSHNWAFQHNVDLVGSYRHDKSDQRGGIVDVAPVQYQTLSAGLRFNRRLSARRRIGASISGGATRLLASAVGAQFIDPIQPSVAASVEFVASRSWSMSAETSRGVTVLAGVNPLPLLNDTVEVTLNGAVKRRLRLSAFGSYARGASVTSQSSHANLTTVAGATAEVRYGVAVWCGVFASYGYYHHRLQDESLIVSGLPPTYDRHSARVGMTLWLPLYGSY